MGNVPVLKPNEVVAILIKLGFTEVRQRGSHKQFRDAATLTNSRLHKIQDTLYFYVGHHDRPNKGFTHVNYVAQVATLLPKL